MKRFPFLTAFAVVLIALAGCSSDSDSNPADNNNNNNDTPALSMMLDGVLWEPKGEQGSSVYADLHTDIGETDFMYIKADRVVSTAASHYEDLLIKIDNPDLDTFTLGNSSHAEHYATFQRQSSPSRIDLYRTSDQGAGTITITKYDRANQLISGTFSFIATLPFTTPAQSVTVTDGTFTDVKWYVR